MSPCATYKLNIGVLSKRFAGDVLKIWINLGTEAFLVRKSKTKCASMSWTRSHMSSTLCAHCAMEVLRPPFSRGDPSNVRLLQGSSVSYGITWRIVVTTRSDVISDAHLNRESAYFRWLSSGPIREKLCSSWTRIRQTWSGGPSKTPSSGTKYQNGSQRK